MNLVKTHDSNFDNLWQTLFLESGFQHPLYQPWNLKYYKAYAKDSQFLEFSMVIEEQQVPLIGIRMSVRESSEGSHEFSFYGLPILYLESQKEDENKYRKAHKILKSELESLLKIYDVTKIIYKDLLFQNRLSFMSHFLLEVGAIASPFFTQMIDLSPSESKLY